MLTLIRLLAYWTFLVRAAWFEGTTHGRTAYGKIVRFRRGESEPTKSDPLGQRGIPPGTRPPSTIDGMRELIRW